MCCVSSKVQQKLLHAGLRFSCVYWCASHAAQFFSRCWKIELTEENRTVIALFVSPARKKQARQLVSGADTGFMKGGGHRI